MIWITLPIFIVFTVTIATHPITKATILESSFRHQLTLVSCSRGARAGGPAVLAVRKSPLCWPFQLNKDGKGRLGLLLAAGRIAALARGSPAATSGCLTEQQLVEVEGECVVGLADRYVRTRIKLAGNTINLTTMPVTVFNQLTAGCSPALLASKMDRSVSGNLEMI